jgi:DNA-directed RNA polymerase specialized sigma24 family protein
MDTTARSQSTFIRSEALGGGGGVFPATAWTQVMRLRLVGEPQAHVALEELCRRYWMPLKRFFTALGAGPDEAEDITQEFIASFATGEGFSRADRAKGRLRSYLKEAARHFLYAYRRRARTQKRGSGITPLSLDEVGSGDLPVSPAQEADYDHEWAMTVLTEALQAVRESYAARGKEALYDAIKSRLISPDAAEAGRALAAQLGIPEAHLYVELHRARQRLAAAIKQHVAATVEGPSEVIDDEVRYLMRALVRAPQRG